MSSVVSRFATAEPVICAVCRRHAEGIAYAPKQGRPMIWLCDNPQCISAARTVYAMPEPTLDQYEVNARNAAGEAIGAYLDSLGKTDLAALQIEEFFEVGNIFIRTYEETMRKQILEHQAPF